MTNNEQTLLNMTKQSENSRREAYLKLMQETSAAILKVSAIRHSFFYASMLNPNYKPNDK